MEPLVSVFANELQAVVNKFRDEGLTVGEALGAIEILKLELWQDQREDF